MELAAVVQHDNILLQSRVFRHYLIYLLFKNGRIVVHGENHAYFSKIILIRELFIYFPQNIQMKMTYLRAITKDPRMTRSTD